MVLGKVLELVAVVIKGMKSRDGVCSSVYIPRYEFRFIPQNSVAYRTGPGSYRRHHRSRILAVLGLAYMSYRRWRNYKNRHREEI